MSITSLVKTAKTVITKALQVSNRTVAVPKPSYVIERPDLGDVSKQTVQVTASKQVKTVTIADAVTNVATNAPVVHKTPNIWLQNLQPAVSTITNLSSTETIIKQLTTNKPTTVIESMTGISQKRPEIIGIFDFLPLYDDNKEFTAAGNFIDAKINLDFLRLVEWQQTCNITTLQTPNSLELGQNLLIERDKNISLLNQATNVTTYFCDLMKLIKFAKSNLDLRTFKHDIVRNNFLNEIYNPNKLLINSVVQTTDLDSFFKQNLSSQTIKLSDVLVKYFGYSIDNIQNFSSTKLWQQTIFEFKNILSSYSLAMLEKQYDKNSVNSNVFILNLNSQSNSMMGYQSIKGALPTIKQISQLAPEDITAIYPRISNTYQTLNLKTSEFSNKMSILLWIFSKEIRFSNGLSKQEVIQALQKFNYAVSDQNSNMFDVLCGQFSTSVNSSPNVIGNDLRSISYEISPSTNETILNFESNSFINGNNNIVGGSTYYFDDILTGLNQTNQTFNLPKLSKFLTRLNTTCDSINTVANGMNWLLEERLDSSVEKDELDVTIPLRLYWMLKDKFVDKNILKLKEEYSTDRLAAVLDFASQNSDAKSLLFILMILQLYRNTYLVGTNVSDTATQQTVVEQLKNVIASNLTKTVVTVTNSSQLTREVNNIKQYDGITSNMFNELLLSYKSPLWASIYDLMQTMYGVLFNKDILRQDKTKFLGVLDTTMLLSIFDAILLLITNYSTKKLDSLHESTIYSSSKGKYTPFETLYLIKTIELDNLTINNNHYKTIARLQYERGAITDAYFAALGTLNNIKNNLQGIVSYLTSEKTKTNISTLKSIIPTLDDQVINLLLNEQQMMLSNTLMNDLKMNMDKNYVSSVNFNQVIKSPKYNDVIDEFLMTKKTKNLLLTAFKQQDYLSQSGFNKKIISVGLPIGFVESFQQLSTTQTVNRKQQQDIVTLNVYRIDEQNPDIVWQPIKTLFELSRFIVKVDNKFQFNSSPEVLRLNDQFDAMVNMTATRDLTQESYNENNVIYYGQTPNSKQVAFATEDYDFLSSKDKMQLLRNHVMSYVIELYVKLFTGLRLSESTFPLKTFNKTPISQNIALGLIRHRMQLLFAMKQVSNENANLFIDSVFKVVNNTSQTTSNNMTSNLNDLLSNIPQQDILSVINEIRAINAFCNTPSAYVDVSTMINKILTPKQFDRVINILIDPDDFFVDVQSTMKNPEGKKALDNLVSSGKLVTQTINGTIYYSRSPTAKLPGNISFDKYHIAVQTVGDMNI